MNLIIIFKNILQIKALLSMVEVFVLLTINLIDATNNEGKARPH